MSLWRIFVVRTFLVLAGHVALGACVTAKAVIGDLPDASDAEAPPSHWHLVATPATADLRGVWVGGSADVWIVGHSGERLHWDGSTWSEFNRAANIDFECVWGSSSDDIWAGGHVAGASNSILEHYSRGTWTMVAVAVSGSISSIWGASSRDVWLTTIANPDQHYGGQGSTPFHFDGTSWTTFSPPGVRLLASRVRGTSATNVWFVANDVGLDHWDGTSATHTNDRNDPTGALGYIDADPFPHALWPVSDDEAWLGGAGYVHYLDGGWTVPGGMFPPTTDTPLPGDVWGSSADDLWFVGEAGDISHYDGHAISRAVSPTTHNLAAIHGSDAAHVWSVGDAGTVLRYDP